VYRSDLKSPEVAVGSECEDVALFDWSDIPWDKLAFPTVAWALMHHAQYNRWTAQVEDSPTQYYLYYITLHACLCTAALLAVAGIAVA
jgi:hypothetical protein